MKFICLGYADHSIFSSMEEQELKAKIEECLCYDDVLRADGHFAGGNALEDASQAVTLRFRDGQIQRTDGPFAETKEQIGGYLVLEADNMEHAVALMSRHPGVQLGPFEIRPADEQINAMLAQRESQLRAKTSPSDWLVQPYLFFAGRCEEALSYYEKAIGATIITTIRYSESPEPIPKGMLQDGFENRIMHAAFKVGQMTLMASDGRNDQTKFEGFRLALQVATIADCETAFNALADGGRIDMPLAPSFWSPMFGMLIDRFNVGWMVMVTPPESCTMD